ncbi:MAG: helix-turn-helix transcriptional regulator [Bacteroidota bacterium]
MPIQNTRLSKFKFTTLEDLKDETLGTVGTVKRDAYEAELSKELIALTIKQLRKEQNLTQEELGLKVGVKKAQISRLEKSAGNVTIDTLTKIFAALHANAKLRITFNDTELVLS